MKPYQTRSIILGVIGLMFLVSCSEREWKSPFDPQGTDKQSWAPQDLRVVQSSESTLSLSWTSADERVTGYRISRKLGEGDWVEIETALSPNSLTYSDQIQQLNSSHRYRVEALADESGSEAAEIAITPSFAAVQISEIETFSSPDSLVIIWEPHTFSSVSTYRVQRQDGEAAFRTLASLQNTYRFADTALDTLISAYHYRVLAVTGDGLVSDSTVSRSVRFRDVGFRLAWTQPEGGNMMVSSDGETLYMLTLSGDLKALRASNGAVIWNQSGLNYQDFALSPDESLILAGGHTETALRLLDASSGSLIWRQYNAANARHSLKVGFNPSGNIITDSYNLRIRLMDLNQQILWSSDVIGTRWAWSEDESRMLFWGRYNNPNIGIIDANDQTLLWQDGTENRVDSTDNRYATILAMGWHGSSGNFWLAGGSDETGWFGYYSGADKSLLWEVLGTYSMNIIAAPDGNDLFVYSGLQNLKKIDMATGSTIWSIPGICREGDYLSSEHIIACVSNGDNILSIVDTDLGVVVNELPLPQYAQDVTFSPDGQHLFIHADILRCFQRYGLWVLDPVTP